MMKRTAMVLCWVTAAHALQAPYLLTLQATNDTGVQVTWRNNAADYQGVVVLRRDNAAGPGFSLLDTVAGTAVSFRDPGLLPEHWYTYALLAYSTAEVSDTSNRDSVQTVGRAACTGALHTGDTTSGPWLDSAAWLPGPPAVRLMFRETACDERGLVVLRSEDFGAPVAIDSVLHPTTTGSDIEQWHDTNVRLGHWYTYSGALFNDSVYAPGRTNATVFTFLADSFFYSGKSMVVPGERLFVYPAYAPKWIMRTGDSLLLGEETGAPAGSFTVLDIADIHAPVFRRYGSVDMHNALGAHWLALGDRLLGGDTGRVSLYGYENGGMAFTASLAAGVEAFLGPLDSACVLICRRSTGPVSLRPILVQPIHVGTATLDTASLPSTEVFPGGMLTWRATLKGLFAGALFVEWRDQFGSGSGSYLFDFGENPASPPVWDQAAVSRVPRTQDGLLLLDTLFDSSRAVSLDTAARIAFVTVPEQNLIVAYQYGLQAADAAVEVTRPHTPGASVAGRAGRTRTSVLLLARDTRIPEGAVYDIAGREVGGSLGQGSTVAALRPGAYIVRLPAGRTCRTAACTQAP